MTFFESITTVFRKYAEFGGVASRPEYWWFALFSFITTAIAGSLDPFAGTEMANVGFSMGLSSAWSLALLLPQLAVTVRRLRDTGRHWGNIFWILVPVAGLVVLIVLLSQPGIAWQQETIRPQSPAAP
ncbi:DUF805 domain-containing protein [Salinibacterium sp. SWN1162]|uniref:DUF805 domain-containing protein n=1 Tax=Salinibacterium sp. SWN1162 TaxID=2792053 RepID=UPI0018CCA51D|nr:DUF805 domain-containing protein [Salinibacterium sp. SWN1162]MBH0009433.1 DUF805 domain-containing protein [Salinibacterium sp. SWN1162]